jgi:hypothetical protein
MLMTRQYVTVCYTPKKYICHRILNCTSYAVPMSLNFCILNRYILDYVSLSVSLLIQSLILVQYYNSFEKSRVAMFLATTVRVRWGTLCHFLVSHWFYLPVVSSFPSAPPQCDRSRDIT